MLSDKTFCTTLIISAIVHGALFYRMPFLNLFPSFKAVNKVEITYLKLKPQELVETKDEFHKRDIKLKSEHKDYAKKLPPPQFVKKEELFTKEYQSLLRKPQLARPDVIAIKKNIQLKPLEINKINNPIYINYYQVVREKIRRCAYQNYTRSETGQIYLTFVVLSNGTLSVAKIIDEKSTDNNYLKEVALKSIKDAAPFPAFPKELDYPHLSFNVIISFEIE